MTLFEPNIEQKALLVQIVNYARQHKIGQTIVPIPAGPAEYAIYVREEPSLRLRRLSDLDALCAADVLSYRLNRMGNSKVYLLTKASFRAAERWQEEPVEPLFIEETAARKFKAAFADAEHVALDEFRALLAIEEAELRRRLPAGTPREIVQRISIVGEQVHGENPNRTQIAYQLRRIGRFMTEKLHDRRSSDLLAAFSRWSQAIFRYLEKIDGGR